MMVVSKIKKQKKEKEDGYISRNKDTLSLGGRLRTVSTYFDSKTSLRSTPL